MHKLALFIVLTLVGMLAGCRATEPTGPSFDTHRLRSEQLSHEQPSHGVQLASFASEVNEIETIEVRVNSDAPPKFGWHEASMTLADLEALARQHNPTLAAAAARIDAARGKQIQARLYPNPIIGYQATEIGIQGTAGQQGAFVNQRIITGGKRGLDQAVAGREIHESNHLYHAQEQRILSDVRIRFYEALVARRRLELTDELAQLGDHVVEASERLLAGRLVTENDLLQARIKADEAHILLDNARNAKAEAWRRLSAVIGMPHMQAPELVGNLEDFLPEIEWEEAYATVLDGHPELIAARTRVERARIVLLRAQREPIPDLDLFVGHRHHNVTGENVTNVQVGVPIPIFNRNQGNIRSAEAEWIAANQEAQRIELDLQDRLAVTFKDFVNARQQVERYSLRMVPNAEQSLEFVTNGYDQGQVEYLTLLNAQQTYLRVNLSYLDAMLDLRASAAEIEGQLLSDSLNAR